MNIVKRNLDITMPQPQTISVPFMLDAFVKCRAFRELKTGTEREREVQKMRGG